VVGCRLRIKGYLPSKWEKPDDGKGPRLKHNHHAGVTDLESLNGQTTLEITEQKKASVTESAELR